MIFPSKLYRVFIISLAELNVVFHEKVKFKVRELMSKHKVLLTDFAPASFATGVLHGRHNVFVDPSGGQATELSRGLKRQHCKHDTDWITSRVLPHDRITSASARLPPRSANLRKNEGPLLGLFVVGAWIQSC